MQTLDPKNCAAPTATDARDRSSEAGGGPRCHPSSVDLADYLLGHCSPGTALLVSHHSAECPSCWSKLLDLGGLDVRPQEPPLGGWRELGGGVEIAPLPSVFGIGEAVYALRVERGVQLPSDFPFRLCELLIQQGGLLCDEVTYGRGDFIVFENRPPPPARISADAETGFSALFTTLASEVTA